MPPRASIRVRVLVMQKRADYSYFFKHGQIQFVRVIFLAHFCLKTMGYDAKIYELQGRNL